ncbi:MAG: four helix bundle protein [Bacteroidia bacterium]|nr:four helix bundle protein [Bacteroidia bacterium]
MNKFDLEKRLIDFSVLIFEIVKTFPDDKFYNNLTGQMIRSSTSSALNYGEAQSGESRKDFIHKLKVILKELRETMIGLKIIKKIDPDLSDEILNEAIQECNELISIFVKSVETSTRNLKSG